MGQTNYLIIGLLSVASIVSAQNFEGEIVYKVSVTSKMQDVTDMQLSIMMGTRQNYFFKSGNYKVIINGSVFNMQFYNVASNTLITKLSTSDTLYSMNAGKGDDPIVYQKIIRDSIKVMGIKCDAFTIRTKAGKNSTYFYNSRYSLDPVNYKGHRLGNLDVVMQAIQAMPLRITMEDAQFKFVSEATDINRKELDQEFFNPPKDAPVKVKER